MGKGTPLQITSHDLLQVCIGHWEWVEAANTEEKTWDCVLSLWSNVSIECEPGLTSE